MGREISNCSLWDVPDQSSLPSAVTNCTKSFNIKTKTTIFLHTKAKLLQNNFLLTFKIGNLVKAFFIFDYILLTCAVKSCIPYLFNK